MGFFGTKFFYKTTSTEASMSYTLECLKKKYIFFQLQDYSDLHTDCLVLVE